MELIKRIKLAESKLEVITKETILIKEESEKLKIELEELKKPTEVTP